MKLANHTMDNDSAQAKTPTVEEVPVESPKYFERLRDRARDEEDYVLLLAEDFSRRMSRKEEPDACSYIAQLNEDEQKRFKEEILMDAFLGAAI